MSKALPNNKYLYIVMDIDESDKNSRKKPV